MTYYVRQSGRALLFILPIAALVILLATMPGKASSATYTSPFWENVSASPECAGCSGCGCPRPANRTEEGVDARTGNLEVKTFLCSTPTRTGNFSIGLMWRSDIDGQTQFGNGMVADFEYSVRKRILIPGDPNGDFGHEAVLLRPDGLEAIYDFESSSYSTSDCSIYDTLTVNGSGYFVLNDMYGGVREFDQYGMPDKFTDRNGNVTDYTYNADREITEIETDRGGIFEFVQNADGFIDYFDDPSDRRWTLAYDVDGNLTSIKTPTTPDQPLGVTKILAYDSYKRLTSFTDGNTNVVSYSWVGTTTQVDEVTASPAVSYAYYTGRTERTDAEGNVHRYHYTGQNITQTDMWIGGVAKFITTYAYNGSDLVTIVYPRGNRVDYTYDSNGNMTEKRRKLSDTSSNNSTDIVEEWEYNSGNFVTSYTDGEGNETTYTRDSDGNATAITYPTVTNPASQSASKAIVYNSYGQVTKVTDEESKVIDRTYFTTGADIDLLEKIEVDPSGLNLETVYGYDADWNVDSKTDSNGNEWTYEFDDLRRMTKSTSPSTLSYETNYEYDANGNVTEKEVENVDEDGDSYTGNPWITTTYTYDSHDNLKTIVEEIDSSTTRTTSFDYDDNDNRIRVTKPEGNKDKSTFNERDLMATHIRGEGATEESTTTYTYDDNSNVTGVEDGEGNDTTHTYDMFDRRTRTTNPLGHYVEFVYNKNGSVTKECRRNSGDTILGLRTFYFDERERLWKTADMRDDPSATVYSDAITTTERFKTGHVKTITNADSDDTDITYDNAWRRTSVTDPMGNETTWTLDDNGNATEWAIEEVDGGSTVTHEYEATFDEMNRRLTSVEIDRTNGSNTLTITNGYDSRGNLVWQVNAKGNPSRWTFDVAGRMTKKEVALTTGATIEDFTTAIVTEWGFDKNDNMNSHKDDSANETIWDHDDLDRVITMTYPDASDVEYEYDDASNVIEITDAAGNLMEDTYNSGNQRTSRAVTRAAGFVDTTSESWTYDGLGRMTKAEDNDYEVEFTYAVHGLNSMVYEEKQSNATGTAYTKTVTKTYDAMGRKATELYPSGLDLDYSWNEISRLSTVSDDTNTIADYTYIGSRVKELELQNGTTASYTYTGFRSEIERIHHETSTPATIVDLQYAYDENHDRLYERFGGSSAAGEAFEYDDARRLDVAWMGSATPASSSSAAYTKKIEYTMDDNGNRSSVKVTPYGVSPTTTSYTDNNLNQYTAVGGTTHAYDSNGNLTDDGTFLYEYNYRNLLCRVKLKADSSQVGTYRHDCLGRRIKKLVGSDCTRYIYSGAETIATYDDFSNSWMQDFVYGQVIDEVLMLEQADVLDFDGDSDTSEATRSFYHRSALGSLMEITEMDEDVAVSYRYDPYGAVTITRNSSTQSADPLGQSIGFTGRWHDEESSSAYYRARVYSMALGRFLQRDPLGVLAGPSLFEYVRCNPINLRDPSGLLAPAAAPVVIIGAPLVLGAALLLKAAMELEKYLARQATEELRAAVAEDTLTLPRGAPKDWWHPTPPRRPPYDDDDDDDGRIGTCWCRIRYQWLLADGTPKDMNPALWIPTGDPCIRETDCVPFCTALAKSMTGQAVKKVNGWIAEGVDPLQKSLYVEGAGFSPFTGGYQPRFKARYGQWRCSRTNPR